MATEYEMYGQIMYVALNSQGQILKNVAAGFNDQKSSFSTIPLIIIVKAYSHTNPRQKTDGPMIEAPQLNSDGILFQHKAIYENTV